MNTIDRRTFLTTTGALSPGPRFRRQLAAVTADAAEPAGRWKKAFMLGGVTKGPVLPTFQLLQGGGLRGGRADQPQPARPGRGARGARQDRPGHPRRQRRPALEGAALRPRPQGRRARAWPRSARSSSTARPTAAPPCWSFPAVVNKKVSYRDAYTRSQENIRKLIPDAEAGRGQDRHRGGLEQVPPQPGRVRPLHRRVRQPLGRRLLRRRQRRRVRLPRGMDPRARQADPQDPHQGVRQAEAIRLQARRGRDRLARRSPGARSTSATRAGSPPRSASATSPQ